MTEKGIEVKPPPIAPTYESELQLQKDMLSNINHPAWNGVKYSDSSRKRIYQIGVNRLNKKYNIKPEVKIPTITRVWGWLIGIKD